MSLPSMTNYHILVVLGSISLPAVASPLRLGQHNVHFRQLPPAVQINWATSTTTVLESKTTVIDATTAGIIPSQANSVAYDDPVSVQNPIFFLPPTYTSSGIEPSFSVSVSIITEVQTVSDTFTSASTIYEQPKVMTITEAPSIVTSDFTVTETFIATPGSFWESPKQFQDLSAFRISHFACGQENLHIINDNILNKTIPSLDIGLGSALNNMELGASFNQELSEILDLKLNSSALQLYYPANSVNPGNYPQGGADFYATPLPLEDAKNVTLEYSVFFPMGFDWVHGGKLPGLYGGHMTCSGGDAATTCFSTRLMWRAGGAGELYLYAPKDRQTNALCRAPPESVCDADYGLSISRGSFRFTPGVWTRVRQTVRLNTPGKQDGGFQLEVNGRIVMDRHDIFYRDAPSLTSTSDSVRPSETHYPDADSDNGGGLLGPLLGSNPLAGGVLGPLGIHQGLLPPLGKPNVPFPYLDPFFTYSGPTITSKAIILTSEVPSEEETNYFRSPGFNTNVIETPVIDNFYQTASPSPSIYTLTAPQSTLTVTNYLWANVLNGQGKEMDVSGMSGNKIIKPIGFSGLFFSTFFGGNSEEYATPTDQYTWFKDFAIIINE